LKAVQAWVAAANAHGGLAGHPVELTVADDGNDPSRNRALVQQLVERNKVVAFVHNSSPLSGGGSVQYIQEHQVPVVGIEGGSHWANENAMYFPQMPNYQYLGFTYAGATAEVAVPLGKAKVALVSCVESSACQAAVSPDAFRKAGMTVVYEARVSLAQPDFTAQCLGARNANADVAFIGLDSGSVMRMADSCASVGFDPLYGWPSNVVNDDQLHNPRLDGGVVGLPTAPWFVESLPAVAEMRAAMAAYAPGAPVTAAAVLGWTSAKLMELAASDLPELPTSAAILDGLWKIRDNDLGGLTYPLTFMKGAPNNAESMKGCWWAVRVQDRRWTAPNGAERRCRP
jgi:branched-chain amino acid transport system substrate-binding protein